MIADAPAAAKIGDALRGRRRPAVVTAKISETSRRRGSGKIGAAARWANMSSVARREWSQRIIAVRWPQLREEQ